jgi:hypothetical protein
MKLLNPDRSDSRWLPRAPGRKRRKWKKSGRPRRSNYTRVDMKTACESHRHTEKKALSLQRGKNVRTPPPQSLHRRAMQPGRRTAGSTANCTAGSGVLGKKRSPRGRAGSMCCYQLRRGPVPGSRKRVPEARGGIAQRTNSAGLLPGERRLGQGALCATRGELRSGLPWLQVIWAIGCTARCTSG